jgi:hypothetical protein
MTDFIEQSKFEHRFWLQVLGDHSRFIYNSLSPQEIELIPIAKFFVGRFDQLLERSRTEMDAGGWQGFAREVQPAVEELRKYKLDIINRHLQKKVQIGLPPTFLNHMVNELDEYRKNLGYLVRGEIVPVKSEVAEFKEYLEFLKMMLGKAEVIGTVGPLIPDHMAREECYYLHRLHRSDPQNVPRPECDPTRPRVTD